jgi:hypothetical protein
MNAHKNSTLPGEAFGFKIRRILHAEQRVRNLSQEMALIGLVSLLRQAMADGF